MAILEIVIPPHPTLRETARPVVDFGQDLQTLIDDMIETMIEGNGVGLAANQVAVPLQVITVLLPLPDPENEEEEEEMEDMPNHAGELFALVNPAVTWHSRKTVSGVEGCLSVPGIVGEVIRHEKVRVEAMDRHGKSFSMRFEGWMARIFQHEIDHLQGVLFTDHIDDPEKIWQVTVGEEELVEAEYEQYRLAD
ncbi:MAG: peptide deformylase [Chloroflexota bacterium]